MLVCFVPVFCSAGAVRAQDSMRDYSDPTKSAEQIPAESSPSVAISAGTNEIKIEVEQLGSGNVAKVGVWNSIRLRLRDGGTQSRDVIVRLSSTDSDGDQPMQQVEVSTNPGVWQGVWVYTRMAFSEYGRSTLVASVYEAVPEDVDPATTPREERYRAGRLLGRIPVTPSPGQLLEGTTGLYGVIGDRALGLRAYAQRPGTGQAWAEHHHELIQLVTGLKPEELPDRWMGLDCYSVILWASGDVDKLRGERAEALRNWVNRGGHLVIVLPAVSQLWTNEASNPIFDMLPSATFQRRENVDLMPYRPLITASTDRRYPEKGVLHTFAINPRATPSEAMPILNGPSGDCVVVRRLVGAGMVTVIGFDFNDTRFSQFENIEADVFWHRVLGHAGNQRPQLDTQNSFNISDRQRWMTDRDVPSMIDITGVSAVGALVGFLVFTVYWLAVGPPLFFILKKKEMHRHSWVAFIGGGVLFTVLAWGLATFLRPLSVQGTHFTVIDHVYGQPAARARMWANVLVPSYGSATMSVGSAGGSLDQTQNSIAPFDVPGDDSAVASFPDSRGYAIDTRSPDTMTVPVRATVKQVQVDWSGSQPWDMPRPVLAAGAPPLPEGQVPTLRVMPRTEDATGLAGSAPIVSGSVRHGLPGPLRNGVIIVCRGQLKVSGNVPSNVMSTYADGNVLAFDTLDANIDYDLAALVQALRTRPTPLSNWLDDQTYRPPPGTFGGLPSGLTSDNTSPTERLFAASFLHQLPQPNFADSRPPASVASRQLLHGFDLSRWLTQPCIIVIGFLSESGASGEASPVPLYVNGELVPTKGQTLVRWIYPLPGVPPVVEDVNKQTGRKSRKAKEEGGEQNDGK
jgi:hypothetical protein